jgi:protoheme IX farnesyltransferase
MATEPNVGVLSEVDRAHCRSRTTASVISHCWALAKPDVNLLVLVTVFVGFCLATPPHSHPFPFVLLMNALVGTSMVAAGSGALNQYFERHFDARMRRTSRRPLAAGTLKPIEALGFGVVMSAAGIIYLDVALNPLTEFLAVLTSASYLFVYTPLKRVTPLCTLVGAVPGAIPPLIGWSAASGHLAKEAWALYALLFLWQFPHFMAIAWMYRDDYTRAGFRVLPGAGTKSWAMVLQVILPCIALISVSLALTFYRLDGWLGGCCTLLAAVCLLHFGMQFIQLRSNASARRLLFASLVYLPCVLGLLMLNRH